MDNNLVWMLVVLAACVVGMAVFAARNKAKGDRRAVRLAITKGIKEGQTFFVPDFRRRAINIENAPATALVNHNHGTLVRLKDGLYYAAELGDDMAPDAIDDDQYKHVVLD